jgi:putative ABC transport system permease protein
MLSPRWRKVVRDLLGNKTRTLLVVLSISVGVFAVGTIANSQAILTHDLAARYAAINPASATLVLDKPFDDELVRAVRRTKGVKEAEGRAVLAARIRRSGGEDGYLLQLTALDYGDNQLNKIRPEVGEYPPGRHEIVLERTSLDFMHLRVGDCVEIETASNLRRQLRVVGTVRDLTIVPPVYSAPIIGYIDRDSLEWFGAPRGYNQLLFAVADPRQASDKAEVQRIADTIRDHTIIASGRQVTKIDIPINPGQPPLAFVVNAMLLVLGALSVLVLLPTGFLVLNTIAALLTQQVRQIGVMKALGARTDQVMAMYLTFVALLGLASLVLPLPLSALAARGFSAYMAGILNFDLLSFSLPPHVVVLEIVIGIAVPQAAALYPVIAGTRITVRQAISSYGIASPKSNQPNKPPANAYPQSLISNLQSHLPRPLLLSLRNAMRRRSRLAFTLAPMVLAGALAMTVLSVRASLLHSLDELSQFWSFDIALDLAERQPADRLRTVADQVPGVIQVESWQNAVAVRVRADETESIMISLIAMPPGTKLIRPIMASGRWLLPEDENAVVLSAGILRGEDDINLGDSITLKVDGRKTTWRVVGFSQAGMTTISYAYVNLPYFAQVMRHPMSANSLRIVTERHDAASELAVMHAAESALKQSGVRVSSTEATAELIERITSGMSVLVVFLLLLAALLALVGGLGLMGTLSLNVLERTREIGVLRAIGASNRAVMLTILSEAVAMGLASWVGAVPLSYPLSRFLSDQVGIQLFQCPLSFSFAYEGIALWLVAVLMLSAVAGYLPARRASRLTVRQVLAYE